MPGGRTAVLGAMGLEPLRLRGQAPGRPTAPPLEAFDGSGQQRAHPLFAGVARAAGVAPGADSGFDWVGWGATLDLPAPHCLAAEPGLKRELWRRIRRLRGSRLG